MTKIKFKATPAKTRLTEGTVRYQGQLQHNKVLGVEDTRRYFAEHAHRSEPETNFYLDALGECMADAIAQGWRLDFGPFALALAMRGSLPAANSAFDETSNALAVELLPGRKIKAAAKSLKPVNATDDAKSRIYTTFQIAPYEAYDEIAAEGTRELHTTGDWVWVHPGAEGEGVWIENDVGEKLLEATVVESNNCFCHTTLSDPLAPGLYWFVIASRGNGELLRCQKRIRAK